MARKYVNVIPSSGVGGRRTGGGWKVQTGKKGKGKVISTHSNKKPAVKRAKRYARNSKRRPSTVIIRNTSGRISKKHSYK